LITFLALHLLVLALLAVTAWVAGRLATRRWIVMEGLERLAVPTALGLSLLAHAAFALAALGLLTRSSLIVLIAAIHLLGIPVWREVRIHRSWRTALGMLVAVAPVFVLALYPPTVFDETLYHLPIARAFAATRSVPFLPDLRVPVFPSLNELLFAGMLLLADDVSTHLIQFVSTLAAAALLIEWGRRSFSPAAGWLAAAAFLGNPIVVHLSGTGYVEPLLTLFITASLYTLERWRESGRTAWLVLAALFAGSASGVKYLGLFFVGAVFLAALPSVVRERRWRDLAIASAVALAVLAPTYGRILSYTGNPLFPFFPEVFGSGLWDPQAAPSRTLEVRVIEYLRIPWTVLFDRRSVGWQPPYSPAYLLASPLLVFGFIRIPKIRWLLGMALAYSLLFHLLPPDSRYLAIVLPLVSLALGASLGGWRLGSWRIPAVVAILLLPGWIYSLYGIHREGPLPVSPAEREAYLRKELPAYAAVQHLDGLRGKDYVAYGIYAENLVYHADGTLLGDWNGPASYFRVLPALRDPELFHRRLREMDADYLLIVRGKGIRLPQGPEWSRCFRRIYSDRWADIYLLREFCHSLGRLPAL
jgi:4-amino-4-deoxy-L-arabinose transferase-like glycosyltransferase